MTGLAGELLASARYFVEQIVGDPTSRTSVERAPAQEPTRTPIEG